MQPTTRRATLRAIAAMTMALATGVAAAQSASPAGLWKTIDDDTKKEKSLVRIVDTGGVFTGKVEKIIDPDAPKDAVCKECSDERKDQPIVGMTIIRNVKASADDKAVFSGGDILDPKNGKVYRLRLKLMDDGKNLEVRGYIGPFFRNQTWQRVE